MNTQNDNREKTTTTLKKSVKTKLSIMAPFYEGGNINDVIENLVEKEWKEKFYEMEERFRDINRANNESSK